ncbi:hypothetical protein V6N12_068494 [Hibiscus sabdariffa]|uniref:Uncharacterized protein n=1 Tax=Hibiscus sabdariffa TaxID=183260 RepID=A0ABR2FQC7_9ROSI
MVLFHLGFELPKGLGWFPTSLTVGKPFRLNNVLMSRLMAQPSDDPFCLNFLYFILIGDFHSDRCSVSLASVRIPLILLVWLEFQSVWLGQGCPPGNSHLCTFGLPISSYASMPCANKLELSHSSLATLWQTYVLLG